MAPFFTGLTRGIGGGGFGKRAVADGPAIGPFTITGGTVLTPGDGSRYHVFTSPGTLSVSSGPGCSGTVSMLIVAGGGGGSGPGPNFAGGAAGGGGGVVYSTSYQIYRGNHPVSVGPGGSGGSASNGTQGTPSEIIITAGPPTAAIPLQAMGGGYGATWPAADPGLGGPGGNGGGGTNNNVGGSLQAPPNSPVYPLVPGTTTVYGNAGAQTTSIYGAGGGGSGAGGVGEPPSADGTNFGGDGGAGRAFPAYPGPLIAPATPNPGVFGPVVGPTGLYAGGGGGACYRNNYAPDGDAGPGGGGYGGTGRNASGPPLGTAGVPATGGGGGGGAGAPVGATGGTGGQGIVIVSYVLS